MDIRTIPISSINPAPYNPRRDLQPGDPQYEALERSIETFGCVEVLVWNERTGHLVGGHQRLKVLKASGVSEATVSVVDLPLEREKALNIALNRIEGGWDDRKLADLLDELIRIPDLDLRVTGFELGEARDIIGELLQADENRDGECGDDNFDEQAELARVRVPVTKPGDLITLGRHPEFQHRLLCGDSTKIEDVRSLMGSDRAALFATDPPYLVDYDGTNHPGAKPKTKTKTRAKKRGAPKDWSDSYGVTWDDADANPDLYERFTAVALEAAVRDDAAWYCWHASRRYSMLERVWLDAGVLPHCQIIWAKNRSVPTRTWYLWQHEPCLMGWKQGHPPPRIADTRLPTVWHIDTIPNGDARPDHPTPKPLEVFRRPMLQHTRRGEICYEPFAGSGTQIIAAEGLRRRCFAIEISPIYCDLVVRRFIAFAGEGAVAPEVAARYRLPDAKEGDS